MPQRKWFIVDPERNIDQEEWLTTRVTRDLKDHLGRCNDYAREIATEFEKVFPREIPAKKYDRKGRKNIYIGMETRDEALARCANRPYQIVKWIQNHRDRLTNGAQQKPQYLKLQSLKDDMSRLSSRAKSVRDLFVSDHPEIRKQAMTTALAEGITLQKDITSRVNKAYSEAIKNAKDLEKYKRLSEEDKLRKAVERKDREEASTETSLVSSSHNRLGVDRSKIIRDLLFTLQNFITDLAEQTKTEIVVICGGPGADGQLGKWLLSNRVDSDDSFVKSIMTSDNPAFPILEQFDQFLLHRYPIDRADAISSGPDNNHPDNVNTPTDSIANPSSESQAMLSNCLNDVDVPIGSLAGSSSRSKPSDHPDVIAAPTGLSTTMPMADIQLEHASPELMAANPSRLSPSQTASVHITMPCDSVVVPILETSSPTLPVAGTQLEHLSSELIAAADSGLSDLSPSQTEISSPTSAPALLPQTDTTSADRPAIDKTEHPSRDDIIYEVEQLPTNMTKPSKQPRKSHRTGYVPPTKPSNTRQSGNNTGRKRQKQSKFWCYVEEGDADEDNNDENEELGTSLDDNGQRRSKRKRNS